jgi:hypothetical protein
MSAGIWPSSDADTETYIRFLKRRLQHLEDRAMSADPDDLLVAYNVWNIERLRKGIKELENGGDSDPRAQEQKVKEPARLEMPSVALIDGSVIATLNYDALLEANAQPVPARAENILCHLVSPDRLPEFLGDFEEGYRLMLPARPRHRSAMVSVAGLYGCRSWADRCCLESRENLGRVRTSIVSVGSGAALSNSDVRRKRLPPSVQAHAANNSP